ncbi:phage tail protein [Shewanella frigidimarina]|jgi:phage tail-like protein|uniref:Phage tail protein n=1 Tax=Shewanella frigidimarina TaxID=56812 RepID=A0A106C246_SHEFR|nr:phage tail protein [Shewanella frigidimarina]KVX02764.1 phage tail protein [Shewanella frigidimarina]|tara:strand:- start:10076 stop:10549 length:474 start_codon:yes stop_codon:yes gene_type:complete
MSDDGSKQSANVWPMAKFYFEVKWAGGAGEGMVSSFQEVSGLDVEAQVIEYRAGDNKIFSTIKMPGIVKTSNVTLKKGIFAKDNKFFDWYSKIKLNTVARTAVTISLLDETGSPTMVWTLANAWPTKVTGTDLKSDGNEVAVESIELAHEGLAIANK